MRTPEEWADFIGAEIPASDVIASAMNKAWNAGYREAIEAAAKIADRSYGNDNQQWKIAAAIRAALAPPASAGERDE